MPSSSTSDEGIVFSGWLSSHPLTPISHDAWCLLKGY